MVNKQVEKRIEAVRSEFLLMNHALREEMATELQKRLRELVAEEARGRSVHYTKLDREPRTTRRWRNMEEEYKGKTEEDEEDEAESLEQETLYLNFSQTPSDTKSIFIMTKPPKHELQESSKFLLDVSSHSDTSDGDTSDGDTSDGDTSDGDTNSQPAKCEQEEKQRISSDVDTVADTSQMMKESEEEERSWKPFHVIPKFKIEELRCEGERSQVGRTKEEEALLMERQWKEWMDKQEMRVNPIKVKPLDQKNTVKQVGAAPPVSEKQINQDVKGVDTMKKIKTYLNDFFNPHMSHKWERLENEDG